MENENNLLNKKLSKSAKYLIASDLNYTITALFAETFLVAYFLNITDNNITQISLYFIIIYGIKAILQLIIGKFIKNDSKAKTKTMSIGIVIRAIFILYTFLLGENLKTNFVIVAIIFGLSETLYWSTHELIFIDVTNNNNRKDYMSIKKILSTIVKIVAPIVLGTSIELYSFSKVAIYIFALSVIQIILSLQIDSKEFSINNKGEPYSLKKYILVLRENRLKSIKKFYGASFFFGIVLNTLATIVTVVTVMTFKTSFNLGILTTIFSVFSILSLFLYKKIDNKNKIKKFIIICSVLVMVSVIGLLLNISKATLIIYYFTYSITICIIDTAFNTKKGDLIKNYDIEKYNVEYVMMCETFTEIGNVFGFTLMLIAGFVGDIVSFKLLLLLITLCVPVFTKLLTDIDK